MRFILVFALCIISCRNEVDSASDQNTSIIVLISHEDASVALRASDLFCKQLEKDGRIYDLNSGGGIIEISIVGSTRDVLRDAEKEAEKMGCRVKWIDRTSK
jgi:hypothetical protein